MRKLNFKKAFKQNVQVGYFNQVSIFLRQNCKLDSNSCTTNDTVDQFENNSDVEIRTSPDALQLHSAVDVIYGKNKSTLAVTNQQIPIKHKNIVKFNEWAATAPIDSLPKTSILYMKSIANLTGIKTSNEIIVKTILTYVQWMRQNEPFTVIKLIVDKRIEELLLRNFTAHSEVFVILRNCILLPEALRLS